LLQILKKHQQIIDQYTKILLESIEIASIELLMEADNYEDLHKKVVENINHITMREIIIYISC
jgi:hypothetical protein